VAAVLHRPASTLSTLRYTLLSEGSSDRTLLPLLSWTLRQSTKRPFQPQWAELRRLAEPPRSLTEKVRTVLQLYPCELLFVHRDADRAGRQKRIEEIRRALEAAEGQVAVCVVPVRAQEAWFLFHEKAIRTAAGNPNGTMPLDLPAFSETEQLPNPKRVLSELLRTASGLGGRRRRRLSTSQARHRVAELIEDFSPLRSLPAFRLFQSDLRETLSASGWS